MGLFSGEALHVYCNGIRTAMRAEILRLPAPHFASQSVDDLAGAFAEKYRVECPVIDEAAIWADPPVQTPGSQRVTLHVRVPFVGDSTIFLRSPPVAPSLRRKVQVNRDELLFTLNCERSDSEREVNGLKSDISRIVNTGLKNAADHVRMHNEGLKEIAYGFLNERNQELQQQDAFVGQLASLITIRRRNDFGEQAVVPVVRKQILIPDSPTPAAPSPDPLIDVRSYDDILQAIDSMSKVFERSPSVFREMEEEELRTILLVGLNGIFEGRATAETFNGEGKNDILIRVGDRNVFIAECLMWEGSEYLTRKIDNQLFRYAT